jgi:hypothetical protein
MRVRSLMILIGLVTMLFSLSFRMVSGQESTVFNEHQIYYGEYVINQINGILIENTFYPYQSSFEKIGHHKISYTDSEGKILEDSFWILPESFLQDGDIFFESIVFVLEGFSLKVDGFNYFQGYPVDSYGDHILSITDDDSVLDLTFSVLPLNASIDTNLVIDSTVTIKGINQALEVNIYKDGNLFFDSSTSDNVDLKTYELWQTGQYLVEYLGTNNTVYTWEFEIVNSNYDYVFISLGLVLFLTILPITIVYFKKGDLR